MKWGRAKEWNEREMADEAISRDQVGISASGLCACAGEAGVGWG